MNINKLSTIKLFSVFFFLCFSLFITSKTTLAAAGACEQQGGSCVPYSGSGASFDCPSGNWANSIECDVDDDARCCLPGSGSSPSGSESSGSGNTTNESNVSEVRESGMLEISDSEPWSTGIDAVGTVTGLPDTDSEDLILNFFLWLLRIFLILAFIAFVIYGLLYLMAGVDKGMADKAKTGFTYAIMAIAVALSGYIIINLIYSTILGGSGLIY
jgi:hypothetical protein